MAPFDYHEVQSRRTSRGGLIPLALAVMFFVAAVAWVIGSKTRTTTGPRPIVPRADLTEFERTNIEIFRSISPSVVHVATTLGQRQTGTGTGTGFTWDEDGHVVTNYHVVQSAVNRGDRIYVQFRDDPNYYSATIRGFFPAKDLAVLDVDAPSDRFHPIPVGRSVDLQVGQYAVAIGSPFGLSHTLTVGVVSQIGRQIKSVSGRPIENVIQTDAAINPGNSGGPLLDSSGRLVGVTTAIQSESGDSAGIGFAIPVDTVNRVVPDLIEYGEHRRPAMGFRPVQIGGIGGVMIDVIFPDSPAEKAGLRGRRSSRGSLASHRGDVVTHLAGQPVRSFSELVNALDRHREGETVEVGFIRDGETRTTTLTLAGPPDSD